MILVHFHQTLEHSVEGSLGDLLVGWPVWILVESKAWGVFALLFGAGFALMVRGIERRGAAVVPVMARRYGALALLGIAIEVLLGFQVLLSYAVCGFWLLLVHRWPRRALAVVAVLATTSFALVDLGSGLHRRVLSAEARADADTAVQRDAAVRASLQARRATAERGPSYRALVAIRWRQFVVVKLRWRTLVPDINLALFIVGMLALRHGVVEDPLRHRRLLLGAMGAAAAVWAVHWLLHFTVPDSFHVGAVQAWAFVDGFGLLQDQWLCVTYAGAVLLLLAARPAWQARLAPVGRVGRMAFTAYVLQAAFFDVARSGYGLDVRVSPWFEPLGTVLLFAALVALASWWLARFRFGPVEWLWRRATWAGSPIGAW